MIDRHHGWSLSSKPLILAFVFSILLTIAAYRIVTRHHLSNTTLIYTILALALAQAVIQLIFYFHIGLEARPAWNLITLLFMVLVMIIVVGGSLWIMHNLRYFVIPKKSELANPANRQ